MKIEELDINTPKLSEQLEFYQQVLGLEVRRLSPDVLEVETGYSVLRFRQKEEATPYHIAFHIPAKMEEKALEWLRQRVPILKNGEQELVDFRSWNAKSMYFYDPAGNVLEFISRGHCFPTEANVFSAKAIVGISEIGLATRDVKNAFGFLNEHFNLEKFTGDYGKFCATGDDEGLFIVIDRNRKDWFPSGDPAFASPFRIRFSTGKKTYTLTYNNERLSIQ